MDDILQVLECEDDLSDDLKAHLESCPDCQQFFRQQKKLSDGLQFLAGLPVPELPRPVFPEKVTRKERRTLGILSVVFSTILALFITRFPVEDYLPFNLLGKGFHLIHQLSRGFSNSGSSVLIILAFTVCAMMFLLMRKVIRSWQEY